MKIRMTSYFLDVNVWLALSYRYHVHHGEAVHWLNSLNPDSLLLFNRYTQLGLLRLLTNPAVMGDDTVTLGKAWAVYESFLQDPRIEYSREPEGLDSVLLDALSPHFGARASKAVGDGYLLAFAKHSGAALATFDKGLLDMARKRRCAAIRPAALTL
jgi:uncharacterized protein